MGFSRNLLWLKFGVIPFFLFSGCGDLEPEMQDTRTVILKMDFNQRSSSRSSQISEAELSQYNTNPYPCPAILGIHEHLLDHIPDHFLSSDQALFIFIGKFIHSKLFLNQKLIFNSIQLLTSYSG